MPAETSKKSIDPNLPKYVYAANPMVKVYKNRKSGGGLANLFIGEWMKILDDKIPKKGRIHVRYRGGKGYIKQTDYTYSRFLEIFFIDVNQGDSILIQTPDDKRILIDGGMGNEAHSFIRDKYNLHAKDHYIDFEAIIATHCDEDHTKGLIGILKDPRIAVKRFYHNGLFRRTAKGKDPGPVSGGRIFGLVDRPKISDSPELKARMKDIVKAVNTAKTNLPVVIDKMKKIDRWKDRIEVPTEGFVFKRLDASDKHLPPYDKNNKHLTIEVLWPHARKFGGKMSYNDYGDAGKTVNGNSIVLNLKHGKQRILLAGDLNCKSMDDMLKHYGRRGRKPSSRLRAHVYKAAHHGSQDFSLPFLKAVKPDAAVISSGDDRQDVHGHPRAVLMGTITKYSRSSTPAVFSTELAAIYKPLSITQRKKLVEGNIQVYEKSNEGIVHLRSDGKRLYLGTVFGRKPPERRFKNILWKWDIWPEI